MASRVALCVSAVSLTLVVIFAIFAAYFPVQDYIRKILEVDSKMRKIYPLNFMSNTLTQEAQNLMTTGKTPTFGRSKKFMTKPSRCIAKNCF